MKNLFKNMWDEFDNFNYASLLFAGFFAMGLPASLFYLLLSSTKQSVQNVVKI